MYQIGWRREIELAMEGGGTGGKYVDYFELFQKVIIEYLIYYGKNGFWTLNAFNSIKIERNVCIFPKKLRQKNF